MKKVLLIVCVMAVLFTGCCCPTMGLQEEIMKFASKTDTPDVGSATEYAATLRFDGLYACPVYSDGEINYIYFIRFYETGEVITVSVGSSTGDMEFPDESWFSLEAGDYPDYHGEYTVTGDSISFTGVSQLGTVDYWGTIEPGGLRLDSLSHINGFSDSNVWYDFYSFDQIG